MSFIELIRRWFCELGVKSTIQDIVFGELSASDGEWQGTWPINPSGRVCVITIRGTHDADASLAAARELFREFRAQAGHLCGQIRSLLENEPIGEFTKEVVLPGLDVELENIQGPLGPIELEEIVLDVTGTSETPEIVLTYHGLAPGHWSHFSIRDWKVIDHDISG